MIGKRNLIHLIRSSEGVSLELLGALSGEGRLGSGAQAEEMREEQKSLVGCVDPQRPLIECCKPFLFGEPVSLSQ